MSENTELREQVRARYAQAATAVTTGTRNANLLPEENQHGTCRTPPASVDSTSEPEDSCCAPTERSFDAGLYTRRVGQAGFAYGVDMTDGMHAAIVRATKPVN